MTRSVFPTKTIQKTYIDYVVAHQVVYQGSQEAKGQRKPLKFRGLQKFGGHLSQTEVIFYCKN